MPAASAYRRAPLVDPAYVTLSDASVHLEGDFQTLVSCALSQIRPEILSPLDSVLATRLGGYEEMPPMPAAGDVLRLIDSDPAAAAALLRACVMLAVAARDAEAVRSVLELVRVFLEKVSSMPEDRLFFAGADILRVVIELYRRTGQPFLLQGMEDLRSYLPDVSGLMHVFPFQREYTVPDGSEPEAAAYHARMQRFATGSLMADSLAMTAFIGQYSGSGKDTAAAKAGLAALKRYHGMPGGAFSSDPYLAGRDPARAADLPGVCHLCEALAENLCQTGSPEYAEQLEMLMENALPDLLTAKGVRTLSPASRLPQDDSCPGVQSDAAASSDLLRALYACRRSVWLSASDDSVAYMLPVSGGCVTRVNGVPARFTASVEGLFRRCVTLTCECREPVSATLLLRVPSYADSAVIGLNGAASREAHPGEVLRLRRTWHTGDRLVLELNVRPRLESGYRGSVSVMAGARLMALPVPESASGWQYALLSGRELMPVEENGSVSVLAAACEVPGWGTRGGFVQAPPQNVAAGAAYELTLLPFAGMNGRIAAFPCAEER